MYLIDYISLDEEERKMYESQYNGATNSIAFKDKL